MGEEPHLCGKTQRKRDRNRPEIDATQGRSAAPRRGMEGLVLTHPCWRVSQRSLTVRNEAELVWMLAQDGEDTRH